MADLTVSCELISVNFRYNNPKMLGGVGSPHLAETAGPSKMVECSGLVLDMEGENADCVQRQA